jgi:hypothetical protein
MTTEPTGRVLVTVAEARGQLGIGLTKMYELINTGEIAVVRLPTPGGKATRRRVGESGARPSLRIEQAEIDAFIARHREPAATS